MTVPWPPTACWPPAAGSGAWVIGALIVLWILIGIKNLGKVNTVAMADCF
jgi:purine-cytosine permease-like protein